MFHIAIAAALLSAMAAEGAIIVQQTQGEQDFANLTVVTSGPYTTAGANENSPFNQIFGGDAVANGSFSWTFTFAPIVQQIGSATLLMALYETESSAGGDQFASFTLNGVNLTAAMNALHEGTAGAGSQIVHYTLNLPSSVFSQLATGTVTLSLTLQGPGIGVLGPTTFNGGGIDFSTLTINDEIPEPGTGFLVGGAVLAALWARRRLAARG